jgi:RNA polymerase sigma-70 factor (ECF subfamily)
MSRGERPAVARADSSRDLDLMQRIASRDREAFREFFDSRAPVLLGVLCRITRDRDSAEEILQEVFLQIWQQAGAYRPEKAPPFAWALMMARSRAVDHLRRAAVTAAAEEARLRDEARAALDLLDRRFGLFSAA